MRIRKATPKDLKGIDRIYVSCASEENKLQYPKKTKEQIKKEFDKTKRNRIKGFKKDLKSKLNYWLVTEDKEGIIGFGNAEIKKYKNDLEKYAEVTMIYIKKEYRRKGLGRRIEKKLIRWLKKKNVDTVGSGIYVKNKPSIKLQKSLGFKIIAVRMEKGI